MATNTVTAAGRAWSPCYIPHMGKRRGSELRWVDDPSALRRRAAALVVGFVELRRNARVREIVEQFHDEQVFRVVFESNHLEGAGPGSLTETRKIAAEALGKRSSVSMGGERKFVVHRAWASRATKLVDAADMLMRPDGVPKERHLPVLTFEGRSRLGLEVLLHASQLLFTLARALEFSAKRTRYWIKQQHTSARGRQSIRWSKDWPPKHTIVKPRLVDQAFVKKAHEQIARGLLDLADTEGVEPGGYRIDRRGAPWGTSGGSCLPASSSPPCASGYAGRTSSPSTRTSTRYFEPAGSCTASPRSTRFPTSTAAWRDC